MADYSKFISLANRLISQKGLEVIFQRVVDSGAVDARTGKRATETENTKVMGVIVRPAKTEVEAGHFQGISQAVLIPGDAIEAPSIADRLLFSGHEWEISEIVEIAPAGDPVLYKIGVKDRGLESGGWN